MRCTFVRAAQAALCFVPILVTAACGGDTSDAPPDATPVDGNPGGQTYTLRWGPVDVAPGVEDTRCVTLSLGNDIPVKIHSIENALAGGSHHLIIYRMASGELNDTPTPCDPFVDTLDPTKGAPLMITQRADEVLQLPPGVAFTLQPEQVIRLEMHFINTSPSETITVEAESTFHAMADADFVHEADFLFIGSPDIDLPNQPGVEQTLGPVYFPLPSSLDDVNIFAITGHTHHLGTDVDVEMTATEGGGGTMVYAPDPFSWSEPETVFHDPPIQVPVDGGFRFTCKYVNDSGQRVQFGESANDEMCFFWAYYYPSRGSKVCMHSEMYTENPLDICCPDDAVFCALIQEYIGQL
jgi:hypothetical protein